MSYPSPDPFLTVRGHNRIRAHVFLCMLAYYVEWHMREKLRPMLFNDKDTEDARALRASIVVPAPRSDSASKKDHTKRTQDGTPAHSLQTLLDDLGTLATTCVRSPASASPEFDSPPVPTEDQCQAYELLEVSIALQPENETVSTHKSSRTRDLRIDGHRSVA